MLKLNKDFQEHPEFLKGYGFIQEPTKDGYSLRINEVEFYIPIRSYDVFEAYYLYIITDSATMIINEYEKILAMFEFGIFENYLRKW